MTAITFYFQVHQPYRLRRFTAFDVGGDGSYWDDPLNKLVLERVAERCYLPMNAVLLDAIERTDGRFRCAFALTGTVIEQLEAWAPEALESFVRLSETGSVEFVCETAYHSLAYRDAPEEFEEQVLSHRSRLEALFGRMPTTFRNTELILDRRVARHIEDLGFEAILGEGADRLLDGRSPRRVYRPHGCVSARLLLRDYLFSDDIAFRFSNREWPQYPLMADTFAEWLGRATPEDEFIGLFMDYETFGEHQNESTGILDFMTHLPEFVLENETLSFATPHQVAAAAASPPDIEFDSAVSWADAERDLTAWLGNPMQRNAHEELYELGPRARAAAEAGHPELLDAWRRLTTSDHVYYMATKWHSDGDVHEYFTPYDSPHDSYIVFMNVLDDLAARVDAVLA